MDPNEPVSYERQILLLESSNRQETNDLIRRLGSMGAKTDVVANFEEAQRLLREGAGNYGAILIPTSFESFMLDVTLRALKSDAPEEGLSFVSVGPVPPKDLRKRLRKAGIKLAAWDPINDALLRFQLNRALNPGASDFDQRRDPRIPTEIRCRVMAAGRQKEALVYSLSTTGAFLETPRASMNGAEIEVEFNVEDIHVMTKAKVVYANVPGNLQRPGLPLGMGVSWLGMDKADSKALKRHVDEAIRNQKV